LPNQPNRKLELQPQGYKPGKVAASKHLPFESNKNKQTDGSEKKTASVSHHLLK